MLGLQLHAGQPMTVQFREMRIKNLSGAETASASQADDLKNLQGLWQIATMEQNGSQVSSGDLEGVTVTIKDKTYSVDNGGQIDHGTLSVDPPNNPGKWISTRNQETVPDDLLPAIYELGPDTMRICYGIEEGTKRPTSFETTEGSGRLHDQLQTEKIMKTVLFALTVLVTALTTNAADKKIVLIAGEPSHGPGEHEHRAGCLLLKSCLDQVPGVKSTVYSNGWPADPKTAFEGAATIVVYSDGGGGHPLLRGDHLQTIGDLMKKGVGLACIHYAVEPTIEKGQQEFLDWIGGAFEINRSVNPHWDAEFQAMPKHPVARGLKPFKINDEWYFNMHFRDDMKGVTPLLTAIPPESTMSRANGAHEGNEAVREAVKRGDPQHVAWVCERADGGRGFGFTGAHFHRNWGDENFRKLVLNAILWTAKMDVPKWGVQSSLRRANWNKTSTRKAKSRSRSCGLPGSLNWI